MADADDQDQAPTENVMGNLPSTRPGRRSSRRADADGQPGRTARANPASAKAKPAAAKATPAASKAKSTAAKAKAGTAPATPGAEARPKSPTKRTTTGDAGARPTRGTRRTPAPAATTAEKTEQRPVPPAPRSGWATPAEAQDQGGGLSVGTLVGGVAKQGENLVRGVLKRLGRG